MSDQPTPRDDFERELEQTRATRVPPHSHLAEEALLGAMLLSRDAILKAGALVLPGDFHKPANGLVYEAIHAVYDRAQRADPVLVAEQLASKGHLDGEIINLQKLLLLQAQTPASANAPWYAEIVARAAALRRAIALSSEVANAVWDSSKTLEEVVIMAEKIADRIALPGEHVEPAMDALDLAAMEFEWRWLVPGFFRRGDRMIVTGLEGFSGKTEFNFQLGVQFACGIHPWTQVQEFEPLKVLFVDFENRLDQLQPRLHRLLRVAEPYLARGQLAIDSLPEGINLRTPRGQGWLDAKCEHHHPDVLITGPVYRMFEGSRGMPKHSEEVAEEVTQKLRQIIVRHDLAMIIEAHSPHGNDEDRAGLRPYGASLWKRWPEIGVGLAPKKVRDNQTRRLVVKPGEFTFDFWRGTRDTDLRRPWPSGVRRWNTWSFVPSDPEEVF